MVSSLSIIQTYSQHSAECHSTGRCKARLDRAAEPAPANILYVPFAETARITCFTLGQFFQEEHVIIGAKISEDLRINNLPPPREQFPQSSHALKNLCVFV